MEQRADNEGMEFVLLTFFLLVGPLALVFGVDSRLDERLHGSEWRR